MPAGCPHRSSSAPPSVTRWLALDLRSGEVGSIIWATGFRPDYDWLHVPVLDAKGRLRHDGDVLDSAGLYALGLPLLRRRRSSYISGIGDDARAVTDRLIGNSAAGGAPPEK